MMWWMLVACSPAEWLEPLTVRVPFDSPVGICSGESSEGTELQTSRYRWEQNARGCELALEAQTFDEGPAVDLVDFARGRRVRSATVTAAEAHLELDTGGAPLDGVEFDLEFALGEQVVFTSRGEGELLSAPFTVDADAETVDAFDAWLNQNQFIDVSVSSSFQLDDAERAAWDDGGPGMLIARIDVVLSL